MLFCVAVYADDYTVDFTSLSITTTSNGFTASDKDFNFTALKNSGSTNPTQNSKNKDIRIYAQGTLEISSNHAMTKMVFTISTAGKKRLTDITPSTGTVSIDKENYIVTWEYSEGAKDVTFTVGDKATYGTDGSSKAGQFDIDKVVITYSSSGLDPAYLQWKDADGNVAEKSYTLAQNSTAPTFTFSKATDATVTFSSDNTNVATVDADGKVTVNTANEGTAIITAKSDETDNYAEGEATLTITVKSALSSFKALHDKIISDASSTAKEYFVSLDGAVVTKVDTENGKYASIEKDGVGILLFGSNLNNTYKAGDVLTGTATVMGQVYKTYAELTSISGATVTSGDAPEPTEVTIAELNANYSNYMARYITIKKATVTDGFASGDQKGTIAQDDATIAVYDQKNGLTLTADDVVNINGIALYYSANQICIYSQDDITVISTSSVAAPTFTPAAGTYTDAQTVKIACTSEGTIYYTTDGTTPTKDNNKYDDATGITVSETTTIKAIAIDANGNQSEVATATYTITKITGDGTFENPYTVADVKLLGYNGSTTSDYVWVKGYIVGSCANGSAKVLATTDVDSNISLADDASNTTNFIPVQIDSDTKLQNIAGVKTNPSNVSKEVLVYCQLTSYFSTTGAKNTKQIFGLCTINIAAEGYGTYYAVSPYIMPEGLTGGKISAVDAETGALTINYSYEAGNTVPAGTSLLIKAATTKDHETGDVGQKTPYAAINVATNTKADTENNLLHGADAVKDGMTYVDGTSVCYYILSHSADQSDFGFYWGEDNGAAVTYKAPYAFLAVVGNAAVKGFSLSETPTGINTISTDANHPTMIYDLQGHRVNKTTRGIYIVNGKKVLVK